MLLALLMFTPMSNMKLGGAEGWWEWGQCGQSYQVIYNVEVAKTQPAALYRVVSASVSMNTRMSEKEEGCVFFKWVILYSADFLPTWSPIIWAAGKKERLRNVQGRQAIWVSLENPEPTSQLTYVLTFLEKWYYEVTSNKWVFPSWGLCSKMMLTEDYEKLR